MISPIAGVGGVARDGSRGNGVAGGTLKGVDGVALDRGAERTLIGAVTNGVAVIGTDGVVLLSRPVVGEGVALDRAAERTLSGAVAKGTDGGTDGVAVVRGGVETTNGIDGGGVIIDGEINLIDSADPGETTIGIPSDGGVNGGGINLDGVRVSPPTDNSCVLIDWIFSISQIAKLNR
jgi:hypothetical protein